MEYTREMLIELCERGIVQHDKWSDRDSSSSQRQLGVAWALLKAGCDFKIDNEYSGEITTSVEITFTDFSGFEHGEKNNAIEFFYIPTEKALENSNGNDWY